MDEDMVVLVLGFAQTGIAFGLYCCVGSSQLDCIGFWAFFCACEKKIGAVWAFWYSISLFFSSTNSVLGLLS
jgi:hypothetical protein